MQTVGAFLHIGRGVLQQLCIISNICLILFIEYSFLLNFNVKILKPGAF